MKAVVFREIGDIRLEDVPKPKLREPADAIVRLSASAICGTDLHMVRGTMKGMKPGTLPACSRNGRSNSRDDRGTGTSPENTISP